MKKQLLIIILFASIAFAADFNITSTADFDAGTFTISSGNREIITQTYTLRTDLISAGEIQLENRYSDLFDVTDADAETWKWTLNTVLSTFPESASADINVSTASKFNALHEISGVYAWWQLTDNLTGDFDVRVNVDLDDVATIQGGGLKFYIDSNDYVQIYHQDAGGTYTFQSYILINGVPTSNSAADAAGEVSVRITRVGQTITVYYDTNGGDSWTQLGTAGGATIAADGFIALYSFGIITANTYVDYDTFKLNTATFANTGYITAGSWISATQSMPSVKKMSNTTVMYDGSKASDCIDKIEWLIGGDVKATYTDDICGSALPAGWNYQEDADSSYYSAFQWTNGPNVIDRNWNTFGETNLFSGSSYFYVNYTKPDGAASNSLWQVRDGTGGLFPTTKNVSIPASCWNYDPTKLVFRAVSSINAGFPTTYASTWDCWIGFGWQSMTLSAWNTNANYNDIYEEGMFWNIIVQTTKTIKETDLASGSFDDVAGDFKIKTYLKGDGTSSPEVEEVYGNYEQGVFPATCDMFVNANSSNYNDYDDFTIRVKSNYFEEQSYNSFRVCYR